MTRSIGHIVFGILPVLMFSETGFAQATVQWSAFSGTGTATVQRPAETLRAVIPLSESGENVRIAVKALNENIKRVTDELKAMGADKDSIRTTAPVVAAKGTGDQGPIGVMELAAGQAFGIEGGVADVDDSLVIVQSKLTVEFRLPAGDPLELMDTVWSIKQEIRDSEFNGTANDNAVGAAQALLQRAMLGGMGGSQNPNVIGFVLLARISQEERAALLKEAYAKARENAEELATAAGVSLGEISFVTTGEVAIDQEALMASMIRSSLGGSEVSYLEPDEIGLTATGDSPIELELKVSVTAGFRAGPMIPDPRGHDR